MDQNPFESLKEISAAKQPETSQRLVRLVKVFATLAGSAIALLTLWCFPLAGFHHQYLVGLFGWLVINGEDPDPRSWLYFAGEEYFPNPCGLIPTLVVTWLVLRFNWRMFK